MATYILLLTLTPEGRKMTLEDSESVLRAETAIAIPGTQVLGLYGVLGEYDFVSIMEAPDNEAAARFSLALGVRAGVRVVTMPAIPVGRLEGASPSDVPGVEARVTMGPPEETTPYDLGDGDGPPSEAAR